MNQPTPNPNLTTIPQDTAGQDVGDQDGCCRTGDAHEHNRKNNRKEGWSSAALSHGAVLVYDVTDINSFNEVKSWAKELLATLGSDICLAICGNKMVLEKYRRVDQTTAERFAETVGAVHLTLHSDLHFHSSATQNKCIGEMFLDLTKRMIAVNCHISGAVYSWNTCPANSFLIQQHKAANGRGHNARAVWLAILIKDREMEEKREGSFQISFEFENCAGLKYKGVKDPIEWSKETFTWGSTEKRAKGMLEWQEAHLHSPLTRHGCAAPTRIINAFATVQKATGERDTRNAPFRFFELISDGVSCLEMRDEVHLAIMKQCNSEHAAKSRLGYVMHMDLAMELLALCLCCFPPSDQLEDHLEIFVRGENAVTHGGQFNLKGLLRRRCCFGPITGSNVPKLAEFAADQARCDGKRHVGGALDHVLQNRPRLEDFNLAPARGFQSGGIFDDTDSDASFSSDDEADEDVFGESQGAACHRGRCRRGRGSRH